MLRLEVADHVVVDRDLERLVGTDGSAEPRLNDQLLVEFRHGGGPRFVGVVAWDDAGLAGYAQASWSAGGYTIGIVAGGTVTDGIEARDRAAGTTRSATVAAVLDAVIAAIAAAGGGAVTWWVAGATEADERSATAVGLHAARKLFEMRGPLPLDPSASAGAPAIAIRPFVIGQDEPAWLTVNNRAFAGHHEQSNWTLETITAREQEPWFDPTIFLLHERDGRLAGFCWMKIHPVPTWDAAADPLTKPIGEIYVVGIDPDFHGMGLGRALAVAGYEAVAAAGAGTASLFVDDGNDVALRLYGSLGLREWRRDVAYEGSIAARLNP